jgi:pantoate--beta-alanine ligase
VRGQRDAAAVRQLVIDTVAHASQVRLDYVEVVDAATLEPVAEVTGDTLVALAAFVGKARLIDNVTITFPAGVPTPDLGVLAASSGTTEDH